MIYLINAETNEVIQTFENVIERGSNFVEYKKDEIRAKVYCNDDEYFTDIDESALLSTPDY